MTTIGIIGSGIAGLQLGLSLQRHGVPVTIYSERTPAEQLARGLTNMVCRNACTREREGELGVNHWDTPRNDLHRLSMRIRGEQPIEFSGQLSSPAQAVDMRIYWARLLEDFSSRGGRVVIRTFHAEHLDSLAHEHELLVVASGRSSFTTVFHRRPEHSPFTTPQRLTLGALVRGVRDTDPGVIELVVNPGHGEILAVPVHSFEPDLTGIGILISAGGGYEVLRHLRYEQDPVAFVRGLLGVLREFAPSIYERIDERAFGIARPLDLGYAAITPTVRHAFVRLSNGRYAVALGDAHVVIDPITGQGANSASHAAMVLSGAIRGASAYDRSFCERAEQAMCAYSVPVSDASNARLGAPAPHFRRLLAGASRHQAVADFYGDGFNYPDRFWSVASSPEGTSDFLARFDAQPAAAGVR